MDLKKLEATHDKTQKAFQQAPKVSAARKAYIDATLALADGNMFSDALDSKSNIQLH